jgi:hypothetical protein
VGAVLHTLIFLLLAVCDYHTVALTFQAILGDSGTGLWTPPLPIDSLLAFAVLIAGVYSAWMLKELSAEQASLFPVHHYSRPVRRWMQGACALTIVLIVATVAAGGDFRSDILISQPHVAATGAGPLPLSLSARAEAAPPVAEAESPAESTRRDLAVRVTMWSLPLALFFSAMVAFVGPTLLFKLVVPSILGTLAAGAWAIERMLLLIRLLARGTRAFVLAILELALRVAIVLSRPLITLFRLLAKWARRQEQLQRERAATARAMVAPLAGLVLSASSWALDTEVPDDPIGQADLESAAQPGSSGQPFPHQVPWARAA